MSYARQFYDRVVAKPFADAFADPFAHAYTPVGSLDAFLVSRQQLRLDKELQRGKWGIVYQGELRSSLCVSMPVAIKYCPYTAATLVHCQRELDMMKLFTKLGLENVMHLVAYAKTMTGYYFAMEYMPNGDLIDFLDSDTASTLSEVETYRIATEIVTGVAALHAVNVVHRDIKPDNVFVDSNRHIKLGDFGHAKVNDGVICPGGTDVYNAPELSSPIKTTDLGRADVFSLGMTLFALMETVTPWQGLSSPDIIKYVSAGNRPVISPASEQAQPKLAKLIRWCWQQAPQDRPSAAQVLNELNTGGINGMSDMLREKQFSI